MFYRLWLKRVLFSTRNLFQFSSLFSLFGLILAVAALSTALLVIDGFSAGLKRAIWDISGHVMILSEEPLPKEIFHKKLAAYKHKIHRQQDFLSFEGLILNGKDFKGAFFEGSNTELLKNSRFKKRLLAGTLKPNSLIVGKTLAKDLNIKVGSRVLVVVPKKSRHTSHFSRKQKKFSVSGIANFGRHSLNSRYVFMPLDLAQVLKQQKGSISGSRLWLNDPNDSEKTTLRLSQQNPLWIVSSWKDLERHFFEVIEMDKKIIFFVLLILIFAAGFNVSGSLFVTVFRRTREISILKAIGASGKLITGLFLMEGLVLGLMGAVLGAGLGLGLCYGLLKLQSHLNFIPLEVYQINEIVLQLSGSDAVKVLLATLTMSFLASLLPALRAYRKDVTEGLAWD